MYLRHTTVHKSGKKHVYWRLVRSVRRGSKVRQEVVAHLGELDEQGRVQARHLAASITGGADDRPGLFDVADEEGAPPMRGSARRKSAGRTSSGGGSLK